MKNDEKNLEEIPNEVTIHQIGNVTYRVTRSFVGKETLMELIERNIIADYYKHIQKKNDNQSK